MIVLAFDTCFASCSAALWSPGRSLHVERFEAMAKGQSERIVPMIAEVLAEAGLTLSEIDCLGVTIGPGSFTGVRTGLAVARAFALANGTEIRGTTSLHVMAAGAVAHANGCAIASAVATGDRLVYFQQFASDGSPSGEARLTSPVEAAASLGTTPHVVLGTGRDLVVAAAGSATDIRPAPLPAEIRASMLARLTPSLPRLDPPRPLYLREADAKPQAGYTPPADPPSQT